MQAIFAGSRTVDLSGGPVQVLSVPAFCIFYGPSVRKNIILQTLNLTSIVLISCYGRIRKNTINYDPFYYQNIELKISIKNSIIQFKNIS